MRANGKIGHTEEAVEQKLRFHSNFDDVWKFSRQMASRYQSLTKSFRSLHGCRMNMQKVHNAFDKLKKYVAIMTESERRIAKRMTKTAAVWDPLGNIRKLVLGGIGADFLWPSAYWKTPGEIYQIDILLHLSTLKISTIFCQPVFVTNDLH